MKLSIEWKDKMQFTARADGHEAAMDTKAPFGSDTALTPKQLMVAGICGCSAMDVVALLKKFRQEVKTFSVEADATPTKGVYPEIYTRIDLVFKLGGQIEPAKALEAVELSQTKYCGVSAMVSKAVPIHYSVEVNGVPAGSGQAKF